MAADWVYNANLLKSKTIMLGCWPIYNVDLDRLLKIQTCSYNFTTGKIYRLKFTITTIIKQYNKREIEKQKRENKLKDYEVTI